MNSCHTCDGCAIKTKKCCRRKCDDNKHCCDAFSIETMNSCHTCDRCDIKQRNVVVARATTEKVVATHFLYKQRNVVVASATTKKLLRCIFYINNENHHRKGRCMCDDMLVSLRLPILS
jgi:hypothetical protein